MRALGLVCGALVVVGCGGSDTTLVIDVQNGEAVAPAAVTVSVFDDFGLLGRSRMAHPALPGQLTVRGLSDVVQSVRIAAVADDPRSVDGVRLDTTPHTQVTEKLTLRASNADQDGDGVPDSIDDCPTVADPDQHNSDGTGSGDACPGTVPLSDDLGVIGGEGQDMATTVDPDDMAHLPGADLAGLDMSHPPPPKDMTVLHDMVIVHTGPDLSTPPSHDMANVPILSEGFENGISGAVWTIESGTGSVNASPNFTHRGFYALRVQQNALSAGSSSRVDLVESVAVPVPDAWIRVFAYVPGGSDPAPVTVLALEQAGSSHRGMRLNLQKGSFSTTDTAGASTETLTATTPTMPTDTWVCLEWHVHVAANGYAKAYVNGVEVGALTAVQNTLPSPNVGQIALGLQATATASTAARDYYFDDFAVDQYPIGCTK